MSTDKKKLEEKARAVARDHLGYETLRPGQLEAIRSLLAKRDTLVVMPTGAGKSAIYEIAGLMLPGPTVVVSPLLALQRDQVKSMREEGLEAATLNSLKGEAARRETLDDLEEGQTEFLLLAPEQFSHADTLEEARLAKPSLFVVDEAHCISEWGQDFRPDYLRLGAVIEQLGHPVVLAMTATASEPIRREIVERLGMRKPNIFVHGFDRPNIWLGVEHFHDEETKRAALIARVAQTEQPGIVYVATRNHSEDLARGLTESGVSSVAYHAGLKPQERREIEKDFLEDRVGVIVATNAFGLGIDKPNVRFVFHYDIPESIDAYWQEVGRGGRDSQPARAILFYRPADLNIHRFFSGSGKVDSQQIEMVAEAIEERGEPTETSDIRDEVGLSKTKAIAAVTRLEEVGAVELLPSGEVVATEDLDDAELADKAAEEDERRHNIDLSRLEMMRGYAELQSCRRHYLLEYFGEESRPVCGNCDGDRATAESSGPHPFEVGTHVRHVALGEGIVHGYEGDEMIVLFDDVGYKTLLTDFVVATDALQEGVAS